MKKETGPPQLFKDDDVPDEARLQARRGQPPDRASTPPRWPPGRRSSPSSAAGLTGSGEKFFRQQDVAIIARIRELDGREDADHGRDQAADRGRVRPGPVRPRPSGEAPQGPEQRPRRAPGHRLRPRRRAEKKP
ncbi:MAG: hypothetical protein MZV70_52960 [Desulfobacterales bacterium]|nr:hypothetical protein [Desulfobacterales bacterium]